LTKKLPFFGEMFVVQLGFCSFARLVLTAFVFVFPPIAWFVSFGWRSLGVVVTLF